MRSSFLIVYLLISSLGFAQDSTYRCAQGRVDVKRVGIGPIHRVEGKHGDKMWMYGKVKRVEYEYTYVRTFHGSTQPGNPEEFYKPIKAKSFYFIPVEDIIIKYKPDGQVFQSLSLDSLILRSYLQDGTPRDIYFLNADLDVDSIYRFYENGRLKTKILGNSNQLDDNLVLSLDSDPEILMRKRTIEWSPDERLLMMPYREINGESYPQRYPEKQYYCHGNGTPYVVITWHADSSGAYQPEYAFYDPEGKSLDSTSMLNNGRWTGSSYHYYKSGALEWKREGCNGHNCAKVELWNMDSTLNRIEYWSKSGRDSIVYYHQFKDTLYAWRPPMHFEWNKQDQLTEVDHKHCKLMFKQDGSVHATRFDGFVWESYQKYTDVSMQLEHFGGKDELGFPHGRWIGLNGLKDTVYEINFNHGWLHGLYRVNNSNWEYNFTRTYNRGIEVDSTIQFYKGHMREILYFSESGKLTKKAFYNDEGHLWFVDTTFDGKKFYRLLGFHKDGWECVVGRIDTALHQVHTKRFYYAPDSLSYEEWRHFNGELLEWKEYYRETGALKTHWKSEGNYTRVEESADPGIPPKQYAVRLVFRWEYDNQGNLIKKERLENDRVVD